MECSINMGDSQYTSHLQKKVNWETQHSNSFLVNSHKLWCHLVHILFHHPLLALETYKIHACTTFVYYGTNYWDYVTSKQCQYLQCGTRNHTITNTWMGIMAKWKNMKTCSIQRAWSQLGKIDGLVMIALCSIKHSVRCRELRCHTHFIMVRNSQAFPIFHWSSASVYTQTKEQKMGKAWEKG